MSNISYTILKRKQKAHTKAYALLCLVIISSMGFYTYTKWQEYSFASIADSHNQEFKSALAEKVIDEKETYNTKKDMFISLNKEIEDKLAHVFPVSDQYTTLTRQLDAFEVQLSKEGSGSFEVSNIDWQNSTSNDNYSIRPFRMSIVSSAENFEKFLHLMENSGSLVDQIRLMDITSIRLNFQDSDDDSGEETINFTVQINAYFQK